MPFLRRIGLPELTVRVLNRQSYRHDTVAKIRMSA
jgi:hypothetical protein